MNNTKKLTAMALALAVASASSAVAFAETGGGGSQTTFSATITADAQKDGAFLIVPQEMTVKSDEAEEYGFSDSKDGVTFLDALVHMHKLKYGEAFTAETVGDYLTSGVNQSYGTYYINTAFGEPASATAFYINSSMGNDTAEAAILRDGDTVEYCFYQDPVGWSDVYTTFDKKEISVCVGDPAALIMSKTGYDASWNPVILPVDGTDKDNVITVNTVNADGSISEAIAGVVPDVSGNIMLSFDEPGIYTVTAQGIVNGNSAIFAPYCFVTVKPEPTSVKFTMAVQKDGAFIFAPQEIEVSSFTAEKYGFSDSFTGVTFLDALVAVHELKYGEAFTAETVGDYLTSGVNPAYGTYYITKAFGEPASATAFYINSTMGYDTAEAAILSDGDTVEYCFYQDSIGWSDVYTTFDKKEVSVYVGDTVTLTMSKMGYDEQWNPVMLPVDGTDANNAITVNTVAADGSISEAIADAAPDADGKITLSFDKPGTYTVTAQGIVDGYAAIFAPYCIVTVKPVYELENIKISASATVKKKEGAEDAKIIIAVYDKTGVLTGSEIKTAENGEIGFDISIPNDSRVKMFIWDNENGMKPLAPIG